MKKIFTFIAIFMIATCLTACSTPDDGVFKPDTNDNSQFEQTDKSDSNSSSNKPADKPSSGNNGSASKPNSNKPADKPSKPNGNTGSNKPSNGSNKSDSSTSKPSQSTEKPAETKPSQPAHQHTWVDHTATKQVPRTVHHDAVYETVTIPAVTKHQIQCLTCGQWFDSLDELTGHQLYDTNGACSGYDGHCERDVVITPAHTEQKLVKEAYDETVYDTQTYVDYQYCSGCGQHK